MIIQYFSLKKIKEDENVWDLSNINDIMNRNLIDMKSLFILNQC